MRIWTEAVKRAILRHIAQTGMPQFTRQAFFDAEEGALKVETGTVGVTPRQTATREFQVLREDGLLEFVRPGTYRWLGTMPDLAPLVPSSGVFVLGARVDRKVLPERGVVFSSDWARTARRMTGQWVICQGTHGYGAAGQVEALAAEDGHADAFRVLIREGSYLEFGNLVPLEIDGRPLEQGLLGANGHFDPTRAAQPVRAITFDEMNRILELGLTTDDALLPRGDGEAYPTISLEEEREAFVAQVDRTTMLTNRKVRDRQFRKRVLDVYGPRCALTGLGYINGRGRAETEAAHIMSVEAGGPDRVSNGIALTGTIHWMFDRGLISLSDDGDILLSRAINDIESVERLIFPDRKARFPAVPAYRPRPEYLQWHRTYCFHH